MHRSTISALYDRANFAACLLATTLLLLSGCASTASLETDEASQVQLGPRPFYLLDALRPGPLKDTLESCRNGPFHSTRFSIGHRGAPMQFPEHTRASYLAAARMGAGVIECDVTFTKDHVLVCRHSQCDLATTTNVLETRLADRCSDPFEPAKIDPAKGSIVKPARARCCTSDFSWAELKTLEAKMDGKNPRATTPAQYGKGTRSWRTDLYATTQPILSHAESVDLFRTLGVAMTPELKAPAIAMAARQSSSSGYSRVDYARQLVDAYRTAGIAPRDVRLQSFDLGDLREWLTYAPQYAQYAVWLVEPTMDLSGGRAAPDLDFFRGLYASGIRTIAPPISMLLELDGANAIIATDYARRAKEAGLGIIAWSLERSGPIKSGRVGGRATDFYLGPILPALENDGDLYRVIHALHTEVGAEAIFSDWPAAVTYYANCFGLN